MFVLDLAAARRAGLPGLADLTTAPYEILGGVLLAAVAGAAAFIVRTQRWWLWSLDAAVAVGLARATLGVMRLPGDEHGVSSVTVTVVGSLLYVACRRVRLPVARWSALALGGVGCLGPGLALALVPSLSAAMDQPITWRGLVVGLASVALVAMGVWLRFAAPFALGAVATGLLAIRYIWPVAAFLPRWGLLFLIGGLLLWAGMTWESRVNDVRTAGRYVRGLH